MSLEKVGERGYGKSLISLISYWQFGKSERTVQLFKQINIIAFNYVHHHLLWCFAVTPKSLTDANFCGDLNDQKPT